MVKKLFIIFVCVIVCSLYTTVLFGQTDTVFWFAAPEVCQASSADRPIYLRITTYSQPATVVISQPSGGGMPTQTVNITANSTQSVNLTTWIDQIECKPANTVLNYGLKITATAPVSVYYDVVSGGGNPVLNPEAYSLKGQNALGQDFLIPGQNILFNSSHPVYQPVPYNSFDIVATEDNTQVTITPAANITGRLAGVPFTITLNRGQAYSARATSQATTGHLQGSLVASDKPVAVTVSDDLLDSGVPFGGLGGHDLAGDQIVPVSLLGTEYIAMNGGQLLGVGDQVFVTAVQNGTVVSHNGSAVATLNAGQTHQLTVGTPASYITASNPVSVWQLSGIQDEMAACHLPRIFCTGSTSVSYVRSTNVSLYFNLLVKNGGQGNFLVNGVSGIITAAQFSVVPGNSQWYTAQVSFPLASYPVNGVIAISNTSSQFHMGVLEGSSRGSSYCYFSNFGLTPAEARAAPSTDICQGDSLFLFSDPVQGATYSWTGPNNFNNSAQNPVIGGVVPADSGMYVLTVDVAGCGTSMDTVLIRVMPAPGFSLGNDISVCRDSVLLQAGSIPLQAASYRWSTGEVSDTLMVHNSGAYWLELTDTSGCTAIDTVEVSLAATLSVNLGNDTGICHTSMPYTLSSIQPVGTKYIWSTGMTGHEITVRNSGTYWLEVNRDSCYGSDTVTIKVIETPQVFAGGDTVICEGWPVRIGVMVSGASYLWNTGSTDPYVDVENTGNYIIAVDVEGCVVHDTVNIIAMPPPVVSLGQDRGICPEQVITLSSSVGPDNNFLWSTGDTTSSIQADAAGTYSLQVTSPYHCIGRDTVELAFQHMPWVQLPQDTVVCEETPLRISAQQLLYADSLVWSDGSTEHSLTIQHGGIYIARAWNKCGVTADTVEVRQIFCDIWMPNAFTPNGDGVNDVFRIMGNTGRLTGVSLEVFDRWGQRIFHTANSYEGWDGMYNGVQALLGTYVYMLRYNLDGAPYIHKGNFHLLR